MADLIETDEDEWIEVSDGQGHKAALRHLAMIRDGSRIYHVLGAISPQEDGEGEGGLLLIREDPTADGAQEYVITNDEAEIERVIGSFVLHAMTAVSVFEDGENEEEPTCACGQHHAPGEFCVCGDPQMLQ